MHNFLHKVCNVKYKTATRRMENSLMSDLSPFENNFYLTCFLNSQQKYIDLKKKKEEEHSRISTRVPTNTELIFTFALLNYKISHQKKGPNGPKVRLFNFLHFFPFCFLNFLDN
ncbi:hypothetical protein M9H77_06548 [Catharanthus roseus]|uniref:Uncharacterized protein n=1 Tax=Catharanthus roseus TaxID=4058 RepID=A0ACC0BSU3_CATRO|nr:hypothetical protein M9H77_06548 [Catharanthus roseus]